VNNLRTGIGRSVHIEESMMKALLVVTSLLFSLAALGAIAQDTAPAEPAPVEEAPVEEAPAEPPVDVPDTVMQAQEPTDLLGSWIIGATVRSTEGEDIGPIRDLLINQEDGTVTGAVLSVGGFLGIGAKAIAVDWGELQINYDANEVTMALTREQADAAPEYQFREQEAPPPPPPPADPGLGVEPAPPPAQ
jgi:sporulation protein YlmC with PRC-barrel domain